MNFFCESTDFAVIWQRWIIYPNTMAQGPQKQKKHFTE